MAGFALPWDPLTRISVFERVQLKIFIFVMMYLTTLKQSLSALSIPGSLHQVKWVKMDKKTMSLNNVLKGKHYRENKIGPKTDL